MSVAEFEVLEHPFGWKVEYWDGQAHLTPREMGVTTRLALWPSSLGQAQPFDVSTEQSIYSHFRLVPVQPTYAEQMIAGYFETFVDSVEFCDWPQAQIQASAEKCISRYLAREPGNALPASVMALELDSQALVGLALFVLKKEQKPHLDLLYVRPPFQRQGVATAMVSWGIKHLIAGHFSELLSAYHICNEDSQRWHHKFGFQDIYDPYYMSIRLGWLKLEIWRREKLDLLEGLENLIQERNEWESQLAQTDWY